VTPRLPDDYFDALYEASEDPWQLGTRWYESRKYAITVALLPKDRYRHAFEPGCSVGVLTEQLSARCDHVTAIDIAGGALVEADARLRRCGHRDDVTLLRRAFDMPWPAHDFDLIGATPGLHQIGEYRDDDVAIAVFDSRSAQSVAARTNVPGARADY
jgi:predicted TPR repeat methyltransferase